MAYTVTIEEEKKEIASRYKDMLKDTYQTLSNEDKLMIRKAFDIAADAHKDQRRKTGEPYIYHPIAVAKIVANEIGLGAYMMLLKIQTIHLLILNKLLEKPLQRSSTVLQKFQNYKRTRMPPFRLKTFVKCSLRLTMT